MWGGSVSSLCPNSVLQLDVRIASRERMRRKDEDAVVDRKTEASLRQTQGGRQIGGVGLV